MLEDGVGLFSRRWSLVECWTAFFGFVDDAEAGYVSAEGWDWVVGIEGVGDGVRASPARIALLARAPFALRRGVVGVKGAVFVEVEVCRLHSGERPLLLGSPVSSVVQASVGVLGAVAAAHDEEQDRGIVFDAVGFVFEPAVEPSAAYGIEFRHPPLRVGSEVDIALVCGVGALGPVGPWAEDHVGRVLVAPG